MKISLTADFPEILHTVGSRYPNRGGVSVSEEGRGLGIQTSSVKICSDSE